MGLPSIHICNLSRAKKIKRRGWSAVLSLADPGQRGVLAFHRNPHPPHLLVRCEDLDEETSGFLTPKPSQVERIIEFGRQYRDGAMLTQCNAGISRSTAAALAILADRLGAGHEAEAIKCLLELVPDAVPNLLIVRHADQLLERHGALEQAVREWDAPRTWNQWRREANRIAVIHGDSLPYPPGPNKP